MLKLRPGCRRGGATTATKTLHLNPATLPGWNTIGEQQNSLRVYLEADGKSSELFPANQWTQLPGPPKREQRNTHKVERNKWDDRNGKKTSCSGRGLHCISCAICASNCPYTFEDTCSTLIANLLWIFPLRQNASRFLPPLFSRVASSHFELS
jgi:ferredoxin